MSGDLINDYGKEIQKSLQMDRRQRAYHVSMQIEQKMTAGDMRGAYNLLRGWYRDCGGGKSPCPTHKDLDMIRHDFKALFQKEVPSEEPLPIHVQPASISDTVPNKDSILLAVKRMQRGKSPGPSGICVRDILFWHHKHPEVWDEFVCLIQDCFWGKPLPQEFSYSILCLIPKTERGKMRGIILLEVCYKVISSIILTRIEDAITWHPGIHGFRHKRGTSTCILEAKLRVQLASYLCKPLYQIYLDLSKAYDMLDRNRTMSLLEAYGLGPHTRSIIDALWEHKLMTPKSGSCFGSPFHAYRGVRQGNVISPIIFNIVVDAVLREWDARVEAAHLTGMTIFFYADDERIDGDDDTNVQEGLNIIMELFLQMGLHMNSKKTKAMIHLFHSPFHSMSSAAYARRYNKSLPTQWQQSLQKVTCPKCNLSVNRQYLTLHMHEQHGFPMLQMLESHVSQPSQRYIMDFPIQQVETHCPVAGCPAHPKT
jgi:hypothetical protein